MPGRSGAYRRRGRAGGRIAVVLHHGETDTSWTALALAGRGADVRYLRPYAEGVMPSPEHYDGVVVMGGPQHVHAADRPPYLAVEERFLRAAHDAGRPVLGICLGAQLLASALGGRPLAGGSGPEYGLIRVGVDESAADPVLDGLSGTYFSMHEDSFECPPGARLVATSDRYHQAFRQGSALGVQFHPEMSPPGVDRCLAAAWEAFRAEGADPDEVSEWSRTHAHASWARIRDIVDRWFDRDVVAGPSAVAGS